MVGISITLDSMFPYNGSIGGLIGFPVYLSIIDVSMDRYDMEEVGNKRYDIIHNTEAQRFIIPSENKVEM